MNQATLQHFRDLHEAMVGPEPRNWQWVGLHMSQRMFGLTESRSKEYARLYGGEAREMDPGSAKHRPKGEGPERE